MPPQPSKRVAWPTARSNLAAWVKLASDIPADVSAHRAGSAAAMLLRLGKPVPAGFSVPGSLDRGQNPDGGWGLPGAAGSDLDSTYRLMRCYHLLRAKPAAADKVTAFVAACRNPDGGYGVKPGEPSSLSGVYYAAMIGGWAK